MTVPYYLFATMGEIPDGTERLKVIGFRLCYIEFVLHLPKVDLDLKKPRFVFWCGEEMGIQLYGEAGSGDDQVWGWYPSSSIYVPLQRFSYLTGIPKE